MVRFSTFFRLQFFPCRAKIFVGVGISLTLYNKGGYIWRNIEIIIKMNKKSLLQINALETNRNVLEENT